MVSDMAPGDLKDRRWLLRFLCRRDQRAICSGAWSADLPFSPLDRARSAAQIARSSRASIRPHLPQERLLPSEVGVVAPARCPETALRITASTAWRGPG